MDVAAVRLIDRWLQHPTYGVAAHLANVPRQTPENTTDPLPETPVVVNETEDQDVAERIEPDAKISLVVFADSGPEIEMDSSSNLRQIGTDINVIIAYVTHDVVAVDARRDCSYVLRAVQRCLTDFNSSRKSRDYRTLNGYKIAQISRVRRRPISTAVGNAKLWGIAIATVEMIDPEP